MKTQKYELHDYQNRELPIIFRKDIIAAPSLCNVNEVVNWHDNLEIQYFYEGYGEAMIDGVIYNVKEGDISVINSNVTHSAGTDFRLGWYTIVIDSSLLYQAGIYFDKILYKPVLKDEYGVSVFKRLIDEMDSDNKYKKATVYISVLELVLYLTQHHTFASFESSNKKHNTEQNIKNAIKYINNNYMNKITLDTVAEAAGLSKYYFLREMKNATGMTFVDYTNKLRCLKAKEMLVKSDNSIGEIAHECGFDNYSYFTKTFKKITGYLPTQYAKLLKTKKITPNKQLAEKIL